MQHRQPACAPTAPRGVPGGGLAAVLCVPAGPLRGDHHPPLQSPAAPRAPVDAFFEDAMVTADALDRRLNRLGLLKSLHVAMNRVADLSKLAT